MTRKRFLVAGTVIGVLAVCVLYALVFYYIHEVRNVQSHLQGVVRESADTRVHTVRQRCDLTKLILGVLDKQDPIVAPAFMQSYAKCRAQLEEVEAIATRARQH